MVAFQAVDPGSIPGRRTYFFFLLFSKFIETTTDHYLTDCMIFANFNAWDFAVILVWQVNTNNFRKIGRGRLLYSFSISS